MPASEQPRDPRERPLPARPAGRKEPQTARGVTDVRGLSRVTRCQSPGERPVVGLKVGAERTARLQEPGAKSLVALDVLGLEARALGREAVGPAQDSELLPEGTCATREPPGAVVGPIALHEPYPQVERGERRRQVREGGGEPEPAADPPYEPGAQRVVRDEEHPPLDLAARHGLGDVVERGGEAEPLDAVLRDAGSQPGFL